MLREENLIRCARVEDGNVYESSTGRVGESLSSASRRCSGARLTIQEPRHLLSGGERFKPWVIAFFYAKKSPAQGGPARGSSAPGLGGKNERAETEKHTQLKIVPGSLS
jgi:hypothetical protein